MIKNSGFWKKAIRPIVMITLMFTLFTYVSYSWIRREWTPYIEQDKIMITTGGSLMFQFGAENTSGKTINDILGASFNDFKLHPVSNCTGKTEDFFVVVTQGAEGEEYYKYLDPDDYTTATVMGNANGYLEFDFTLYAPEDETSSLRYVYLEEAYIRDAKDKADDPETKQYAQAVRVSITFKNQTIIFADTYDQWETDENGKQFTTKSAVTNSKNSSGNYVMDGQYFYTQKTNAEGNVELIERTNWDDNPANDSSKIVTDTRVEHFSNYDGKNSDPQKALFNISGTEPVKLTIRVWVEGTDGACETSIAGGEIDLLLKFGSFTVV